MVLKALGLSQLTYAFINTFVPPSCLDQVQKLASEFIWGGKNKTKIKHNVLIQEYKNGGLKAPDIHIMYKSLKYSWIKRLINSDALCWKETIKKSLDKVGGLEYLLLCNYDVIRLNTNIPSNFWKDVLKSYSTVHNHKDVNEYNSEEIKEQIINNNKFILHSNKSINWNTLINNNMDKVGDWLDRNGNFLPYEGIKRKIRNLTWLHYFQIITAIPQEWKIKLGESIINPSISDSDELERMGVASKQQIKQELLERKLETPTGICNWNMDESCKMSAGKWKKIFLLSRKITKEVRFQIFQYRILHQTLPTKQFLYRRKIRETPLCNTCGELETVKHMLFECQSTQKLWTDLAELFYKLESQKVPTDLKSCVFGCLSKSEQIRKWNHIALSFRYYIYRTKCENKEVAIASFLAILKCQLCLNSLSIITESQYNSFLACWNNWL